MSRFADFLARLRHGIPRSDQSRLAAILELNRGLAMAQDRQSLLVLLLDQAVALFGAERGFLVLSEAGSSQKIVAARSLDREAVRNPEQKISSTIVRRCLETGSGVFSDDALTSDFAAAQSVADMKLRSVLCMPLLAAERLLGCIYLDHRFQSSAFHADDLPWLQAFADQAAIALHLHELLEENRAFAADMERRNRELLETVAAQAQELNQWQAELSRERLRFAYPAIIGHAPALLRCLHLLDRVVPGDYPVMLFGESGTGKELAARAIWAHGKRSTGPFVAVNVAAMNPGVLESELFGHVRGAFTGAERDRVGLLREADGGVLFLDEVTEMDPDLQVKLLRFLEQPLVRPVGGDLEHCVDLRVVAATNRQPLEAVQQGRLRSDLYYRLAVITVELPPLRERLADIAELAEHFLREAARERGATSPRRIGGACLQALAQRSWPGNLRQLRNEVFRLDALSPSDDITPDLLGSEDPSPLQRGTLELAALERAAIQDALRVASGNKAEAARLLGISRRTLYNKLKLEDG